MASRLMLRRFGERGIELASNLGETMNIRQAILKAADSIEQYPKLFEWKSVSVANPECGTPGCAIGWICRHLGHSHWEPNKVVGIKDCDFYERMNEIHHDAWKRDHKICADILRIYADKYHPDTDHIPASIRAIFTEQVTA